MNGSQLIPGKTYIAKPKRGISKELHFSFYGMVFEFVENNFGDIRAKYIKYTGTDKGIEKLVGKTTNFCRMEYNCFYNYPEKPLTYREAMEILENA